MLPNEIREQLRAPMPDEAIQQHPTKTFLSTIKAIYIVERLNDVFGIGMWELTHEIVSDTDDYVTVCGQLSYVVGERTFYSSKQYGGHKKTGKGTEPADGYKSAVTDCLSKCASLIEVGIDVFKGKKTHTKGRGKPRKSPQEPLTKSEPQTQASSDSTDPKKEIFKKCQEKGLTKDQMAEFVELILPDGGSPKEFQWMNDKFDECYERYQKFLDANQDPEWA